MPSRQLAVDLIVATHERSRGTLSPAPRDRLSSMRARLLSTAGHMHYPRPAEQPDPVCPRPVFDLHRHAASLTSAVA